MYVQKLIVVKKLNYFRQLCFCKYVCWLLLLFFLYFYLFIIDEKMA